jgi:hypothetical protein
MNGNTNNTTGNTKTQKTTEEYNRRIYATKRGEYGFHHFQDPEYQSAFEHRETKYRLAYFLKEAYDKQELLRKIRADMKREYLTRKRQMKQLEQYQAGLFRSAEMKLQEYYSSTTGVHLDSLRKFAIASPTHIATIHLPFGNTLHTNEIPLSEVDMRDQFSQLREFHVKLRYDKESELREAERQQDEEEERERRFEELARGERSQRLSSWIAALPPHKRWTYFLTFDEQDIIDAAEIAETEYEEACDEGNKEWMESCRAKMERGAGIRKMKIWEVMTPEEREVDLKECRRRIQEYGADTRYTTMHAEETETEEQKAEREEYEMRCQMLRDEKEFKQMLEDDGLVVPQLNDAKIQESKAFVTCGSSAKSKPSASASASAKKAAKARIAKQQKKKYVPLAIHEVGNTKVSKDDVVVIDMPKKTLQGESREDVKRYNRKWNKKNAMAKQSSARGTGIPNLYVPNKWDCNSYSDDE